MSRRRSVTTRRLDDITARLDDLDWSVLADLDRLRMVTATQIQRLHHGDGEAARKRRVRQLSRLSRMGLTMRMDGRIGGPEAGSFPSIYTLDVAGIRLLHPERSRSRRPWTPSNPYVAHHLAVAEVYVTLVELARTAGVDVEILSFTTEPACWRSWTSPLGAPMSLKPDAHVVLGAGSNEAHWWVEVDRASESLPRVLTKCRSYIAYWRTGIEESAVGVFPKVLWVVPDERRRGQLVKAVGRLDAEDRILFAVATDDEAAAAMAGIAPEVSA